MHDELFAKAKARVIEEVAIRILLDHITPEGNVELPRSWFEHASHLADQLVEQVKQEAAAERAGKVR